MREGSLLLLATEELIAGAPRQDEAVGVGDVALVGVEAAQRVVTRAARRLVVGLGGRELVAEALARDDVARGRLVARLAVAHEVGAVAAHAGDGAIVVAAHAVGVLGEVPLFALRALIALGVDRADRKS